MRSIEHRLEVTTDQETPLALIAALAADPAVHGISVQLPLPAQIDAACVLDALHPAKDVDGFNPVNVARRPTQVDGALDRLVVSGCSTPGLATFTGWRRW